MTRYDTSTIHRYLDGVFADVALTPEVQDLKEEIRGNLAARVSELEASGMDATAASRKAIKELGDVNDIVAQLGVDQDPDDRKGSGRTHVHGPRATIISAHARNKVRPRPGFVVRAALLSIAAAAGAAAYVFSLVGGDSGSRLAAGPAAIVVALPIGLLVADSLRQETTANHPLPTWRAAAYGLATALLLGGLGLVGFRAAGSPHEGWLVTAGVPLVVAAVVAFAYLGATQTNRKKAWARVAEDEFTTPAEARFNDDPAAQARFGIYSGVVWISALGTFIATSIQFGFKWSWLAFLVALLIEMAMVARVVFPNGGVGTTQEK